MMPTITALDIVLDRAFYRPGEEMTVSVTWRDDAAQMTEMRLQAKITYLTAVLDTIEQDAAVGGDEQTAVFAYTPPASPAPRGYGLDVCLETTGGEPLACAHTAFDVLDVWTQTPRYGFLSDFAPGRDDSEATLDSLLRYHINGLQFYDWMYRHEQLLTEDEPYTDLLGRRLSLATTEKLIAAAHDRNMAAMPYTAVYAASIPFYEDHRDWALYEANGKPHYFGENFLVYMDPRPDSDWTKHLLDQFDQVLRQTDFDGIHLDQYGAPKEAFDRFGHKFNLAQPLADLIDATKSVVDDQRTDGAVVFNAVTNWPVETVAPANQNIVYIEVWEPYVW
ncbi:MAG: hypothetical protein KC419_25125, partial [Anaerolineales bacterium]|nr:hypothetical protein [Anaerolineales bacterium]